MNRHSHSMTSTTYMLLLSLYTIYIYNILYEYSYIADRGNGVILPQHFLHLFIYVYMNSVNVACVGDTVAKWLMCSWRI